MTADWPADRCGCRRPLHYHNPIIEAGMREQVARLGALIKQLDGEPDDFLVPRHFIALHGIRGQDLPALAAQYGWPRP